MTNSSGSVLLPKKDGRIQIPQESLALICLNFSANQVVGLISGGDPRVNDIRRSNPALIFLDLGLADSEKRHHISTFMGSLKDSPVKPLKVARKLDVSDKGQILLPPEFLSLFQDIDRRARLVLLNGKGQTTHGFALSFQQKFPYGSNGRS